MNNSNCQIEEWAVTHPNWPQLQSLVDRLEQTDWLAFQADWHLSRHVLVARLDNQIAGFLYMVIQPIGLEEDHDEVKLGERVLTEAKVIAFGVAPEHRRQGIGRALQLAALKKSTELDCYQLRSHSSGSNLANHRLKLALGFSVQPVLRDNDTGGVYFLMTLRPPRLEL